MKTYRCYVFDDNGELSFEVFGLDSIGVMDHDRTTIMVQLHDAAKISGVIDRNYKQTASAFYDAEFDDADNFISFV